MSNCTNNYCGFGDVDVEYGFTFYRPGICEYADGERYWRAGDVLTLEVMEDPENEDAWLLFEGSPYIVFPRKGSITYKDDMKRWKGFKGYLNNNGIKPTDVNELFLYLTEFTMGYYGVDRPIYDHSCRVVQRNKDEYEEAVKNGDLDLWGDFENFRIPRNKDLMTFVKEKFDYILTPWSEAKFDSINI